MRGENREAHIDDWRGPLMTRRACALVLFFSTAFAAGFTQNGPGAQPREPKGIYVAFVLDGVAHNAYTTAYPVGLLNNPGYPYPALALPPTNDVLIKYFT